MEIFKAVSLYMYAQVTKYFKMPKHLNLFARNRFHLFCLVWWTHNLFVPRKRTKWKFDVTISVYDEACARWVTLGSYPDQIANGFVKQAYLMAYFCCILFVLAGLKENGIIWLYYDFIYYFISRRSTLVSLVSPVFSSLLYRDGFRSFFELTEYWGVPRARNI